MALLTVDDVGFGYGRKPAVFEGISFEVQPGEVFCIIGPNGCGKTTLIDCILGMNKLKKGAIRIEGTALETYGPREFAAHMAYVPQSHQTAFPYRVLDIVVMGCTHTLGLFASPREKEKVRARRALAAVGLKGFENRLYTELSGGELQLVLVARALAQSPKMLIMDEPTAHLDFCHELSIMEIIVNLVKEQGLSIVMATHFLNQAFYLEAAGVPVQVALMNGGHFEAIGSPSEILSEANLARVFQIVTKVAEEGDRKYIIPLKNERDAI